MKILVILTGGTISCSVVNGRISPDRANNVKLISNYLKHHNDGVIFESVTPYMTLSENLTARELSLLTLTVGKNLNKDYDGIIVTHGTDTLQYSSVAVEQCFENAEIPIVFVSANYPLDNENSNGYSNFEAAVELIKARIIGTFICYKNYDCVEIFEPNRVVGHMDMSDRIYSFEKPYAIYEDGNIQRINVSLKRYGTNFGAVRFADNPQILVIQNLPVINIENVKNFNEVIIKPYHSGTINTVSKELKEICKTAKENCIPIYLPNSMSELNYESKTVFEEYGIIPLSDTTFFDVYVRSWIKESLKIK